MTAKIRVLDTRRCHREDALRGFATAQLGCIRIGSIRIIQPVGTETPWIALPQVPARRKVDGGGSGWFPAVTIENPAVYKALSDAGHPGMEGRRMSTGLSSVMATAAVYRKPKTTAAQYRVLAKLAKGDSLVVDQFGVARFRSGDPITPSVVKVLVDRGWATKPLPELPMFNEPPVNGEITLSGQAAIEDRF